MEPSAASEPVRHCQACGTDMPQQAVRAYRDDDDAVQFVCRDWQACGARIEASREAARQAAGPVQQVSFAMEHLNRLTDRIQQLEARMRKCEHDIADLYSEGG